MKHSKVGQRAVLETVFDEFELESQKWCAERCIEWEITDNDYDGQILVKLIGMWEYLAELIDYYEFGEADFQGITICDQR